MGNASPLEYVDVVISRDIEVVSRVGFGTALFVGITEGKQTPRLAQYPDFEAVSAVFDAGDPEYEAALVHFGQSEKPERLFIGIKEYGENFVDAIQAIQSINSDWYAISMASRDSQDIEDVAAYTQTQNKMFFPATADSDVLDDQDDTDIASTLLDLNYDRTALFFHSGADLETFPEMAWLGRVLPLDPGSENWAWKTLAGIPSDTLTPTQRRTLEEKRATYYTTVAGNNVTFEGQVSEPGVFVDLVRGTDWLRFRLAEDVVAALAANDKIPYIGGDSIIEARIRSRLEDAVDVGLIAEGYEVNVPPANEQSTDNRVARIYNDITFSGLFTGAVNRVAMRGSFSV